MPKFSELSRMKLETCHPKLQELFNEIIKYVDCIVLDGHRGEEEQTKAYTSNPQRSKTPWPTSKHNSTPSMAVDVVPFPVEWPTPNMDKDEYRRVWGRFYYLSGYIKATADKMGIGIEQGIGWSWQDPPHIQLRENVKDSQISESIKEPTDIQPGGQDGSPDAVAG